VILASLTFPQIGELVDWKHFLLPGFNKPVLIVLLSCIITLGFFIAAGRKRALVPVGVQNAAEMLVDMITDQIVLQTIGDEGMVFLPYLTTLFCFIFFCNIFEIIPGIQFPATARMAIPLFLAIITWLLYNFMGFKSQGFHYIKNSLVPPGLPGAVVPLYAFVELLQLVIVRPFSLAVRLFANMLAGHTMLAIFGGFAASIGVLGILPLGLDVLIFFLELLVAVLQAYVFTILTCLYLNDAIHLH